MKHPSRSASSSTARVTPVHPPGLSSAGTDQNATGTISTLMEGHVQPGWLCELETGGKDSTHENEAIEILVETGATEHDCGPYDFTHVKLEKGPQPALKTGTGAMLKHYGKRTVDFRCQGQEL